MKIISFLLSPIFALVYFLLLVIFHPLQWIGLNVFGYKGHKKVVDMLNWCLAKSLLILGVPVIIESEHELPTDKSLIVVSNHQSMFDISPISVAFSKHHPKFVAKIELGKGIPSVSFNLRHGGAALIDRKNPKHAISTLAKFSKRIQKNNWSAIIFPEGTRSKTGTPKKFASNGLKVLIKYNPDAVVAPMTINNSWKLFRYGKFPLGVFQPVKIKIHQPIAVNSLPFNELLEKVEKVITENIH